MRIRLETTERDPFWLIGNPAKNPRAEESEAYEEVLQITRQQQSVAGAGQDVTEHFDRGNQKLVLEATVKREFESEWARMDFLARLAAMEEANQEHLWSGDAWIRLDKMDGSGDFREWLLPGVVVALSATRIEGAVSLHVRYRITAGGFGGETREGNSSLALLIGSDRDYCGIINSIAELDALMSASYGTTTDYFNMVLHYGLAGGGGAVSTPGARLMTSGATLDDEFNLPLSGVAADVAEFLAGYVASVVSQDVAGDVMRFFSPTLMLSQFSYFYLSIDRHWTDPEYGPQSASIYSRSAVVIPGSAYRLLGTEAAAAAQLTGLIEG